MLLIKSEIRKQERKKVFKSMEKKRNKEEKEIKLNGGKQKLLINHFYQQNDIIIENIVRNMNDNNNTQNNQFKQYISKEILFNVIKRIDEIKKYKEIENNKTRDTIEEEKYKDVLIVFEKELSKLYRTLFLCENIHCKQFKNNESFIIIQEEYLICQECKLVCCNSCIMMDKKNEFNNYCKACKLIISFGGNNNNNIEKKIEIK
jgi:hypothetical protein